MYEGTNNQERCVLKKVLDRRTERKGNNEGLRNAMEYRFNHYKWLHISETAEIKWLEFVYFLKDSG